MMHLYQDKLLLVLTALLGLTFLSWLLFFLNLDAKTLGALLIGLAFIKTRLVIIHFMEASKTLMPIRLAFEAWVLLSAIITLVLYLR